MISSEFQLIDAIRKLCPPGKAVVGIGDDCAVIEKNATHHTLLTTDSLVEKVHFDLTTFSFKEVGHKALAVNLSDIAAMGGKPLYALVSLGLPPSLKEESVLEIYEGINSLAEIMDVAIVGGNISRLDGPLFISITLIGEVEKGACKFRTGAKKGDLIFITGPLGRSALGLALLRQDKRDHSPYAQAQKKPMPRIKEGLFLGSRPEVTSLMDISDGLAQDLQHLLKASGLGANLDVDQLRFDKPFLDTASSLGLDPMTLALSGGEDYELLFTVDSGQKNLFLKAMAEAGHDFFHIAACQPSKPGALTFYKNGQEIQMSIKGFDHLSLTR